MVADEGLHAVTGAFGYSGKYIARRLLAEGRTVITLTGSANRRNPFGDGVRAFPFDFDQPEKLRDTLRDVAVLYNTYWVRFNSKRATYADALRNTQTLFRVAKAAGVRRIVHVSITNPSENSPLEYFRGKAQAERALCESGVSYAILRPAILFGQEDILVNNIAWALRHMPVLGVFGRGDYKLRPIYVEDLAQLAVEQGKLTESTAMDAVGPESFTYRQFVQTIGEIIGKPRPIVSVPPLAGYLAGWAVGRVMGDVLLTRDEIRGLMANLLYVDSPRTGATKLTEWAQEHADTLGLTYASELARR
jgi:uncharacterized protein YbjT (DUF2867 family)